MIEPSLQLGGGNWANKSDSLLGYHKEGANFYADELTFSRNSEGSYTDANGLIQSMPYNLLTYSEQFDNAAWGKAGTVITANTTTAPNGTLTADTCSTSQTNTLNQVMSASTFITYTFSVYVKLGTATNLCLSVNNRVAWDTIGGQSFDSSNGLNTTTWTRISYTFTPSSLPLSSIDCYIGGNYETGLTQSTGTVFIYGAQLNQGSTALPYFATTTRFNLARVDYKDNVNGSLLLEPQSTNIAIFSEQMDNAAYTKVEATITANSTTSPDGTINADKLVENTINEVHAIVLDRTFATGTYVYSFFAKAAERTKIGVFRNNASVASFTHTFDLSAGTATGGGTIEPYANGFFRCSGVISVTAASTGIGIYLDNGSGFTYTGNGTSGIFLWGWQYELSSYATSYIKSEGAATTRLADTCLTSSVPSLIGQSEGVLFIDFNRIAILAPSAFMISAIAGTTANSYLNSIYIYQLSNGNIVVESFVAGVQQFGFSSAGLSVGKHKIALGYKLNDFVLYIDGVQIGADTSGSVPAMNFLTINGTADVPNTTQSVNQALLYTTRLTNAELATLTTL